MPLSDKTLPISETFHELVGKTREADLEQEEKRFLAEKEARKLLFQKLHPGQASASEAFLPDDEKNEKLASQLDKELHNQAAIKKAAEEQANATVTGDFPPPPTTQRG